MAFLDNAGVAELWARAKDAFARKMDVSAASTTVDILLKNNAGVTLATSTLPAATGTSAGVLSAADKTKLDAISPGASSVTATLNGVVTTTPTWYAPTTAGTTDYVLKSAGSGAPVWAAQSELSVGTSQKLGTVSVGSATLPIYLSEGTPTACDSTLGVSITGTAAKATADADGNVITTTYAPLASPVFTGTPAAPTASAGTSTTQLATTAFVTTAVTAALTGTATYKGAVSSNDTISGSEYKVGWYWYVATAGTYVGQQCEVGDMIICKSDKATAYSADDFNVIQFNIVAMTTSEVDAICTV
jgi:hypothetical protein